MRGGRLDLDGEGAEDAGVAGAFRVASLVDWPAD
jgi:hypothetical protein